MFIKKIGMHFAINTARRVCVKHALGAKVAKMDKLSSL